MKTEKLTLFPYQHDGIQWLQTKRRALLGDDMGLGKTVQVIKAIEGLNLRSSIIICPPIARITWEREFRKWSNRSYEIQILEKTSDKINPKADIVICSFVYATKNKAALAASKRDLLVVDESHYLKSDSSQRTQAVLAKGGIIHSTARSWFLTGTPMPNNPYDLWPMLFTFGATRLTADSFIDYFCEWYDYANEKTIKGAIEERIPELSKILKSIMLRRERAEVLKDLPPIMHAEILIEGSISKLSPAMQIEFNLLSDFIAGLENITDPSAQVEALTLVAKSITTLRRYCAIMKVDPVADLITDELLAKSYPKIIIFAVHREAIEALAARLKPFGVVLIHGGIGSVQRQANIDRFQNDPTCRVLIANIQAASTNITLTASNQTLFLEQSFQPGENNQAIARASRLGQKYTVFNRFASIAGTIDEKVQKILHRKAKDIRLLMSGEVLK